MNDIFDIKGVINISPFANSFFVFILILLLVCIIGFLIFKFKNRIINKEKVILTIDKKPFIKMLNKLEEKDANYFERLNFIVKLYLDKKNIIPGAVNLTGNEIVKIFQKENNEMKDDMEFFLIQCSEYQFSSKEIPDNLRNQLGHLAKKLILKI